MTHDYDIIIVGGGAVGAALACALTHLQQSASANNRLRIAVIEAVSPKADAQPSYDDRGLSISLSSKNILDNIGIWQNIASHSNPIKKIHVSDQHHFGFVRLDAESMSLPALGYVVLARELGKAFNEVIKAADDIDLFCPALVTEIEMSISCASVTLNDEGNVTTITGKLLVAADGAESKSRRLLGINAHVEDYEQVAIVSNVMPEQAHANTAYERFTETGPLALLPHTQQRCVVVFTVATVDAERYLQMDEQSFLECLMKRFGRRLGRFSDLGQRKSYPIKMLQAEQQIQHRAVVLGNAAHTVHPNAGQGFNLGLRDAAALAEILIAAQQSKQDIGEINVLETYLQSRTEDQERVMQFTDRLVNSFYNRQPLKILARNLLMLATDLTPPLKQRFTHKAMGFWGHQPSLVSRSSSASAPEINFPRIAK